jgi:uncharacterized protein YciI
VDYLVYGRAAFGVDDQDAPALDGAHWSYMDAFAARMTARGPTLSPDRTTWTGSLHVIDVDDCAAAHAFAVNDPYHRAGLFRDHLVRRFDNLLGRTMWDSTPAAGHVPFLIIADGGHEELAAAGRAAPAHLSAAVAARLALWGRLYPAGDSPDPSDPCDPPSGVALAVLAPDEAAARALIEAESTLLGERTSWQIHAWEFGGRR